ncbi:hypothetical protein ACFFWE_37045 [Sphaerisporangium melleum]|uniref:hypothetical protein n=1 Tax=Sphaerisporangium melleum TaxID=321316 RepID=UPI0016675953|nr:hypothetical protein [Sphaerisporangium melleum]
MTLLLRLHGVGKFPPGAKTVVLGRWQSAASQVVARAVVEHLRVAVEALTVKAETCEGRRAEEDPADRS